MNSKSRRTTPSVYRRYWAYYGGWRALFGSNYLFTAILVTGICFRLWEGDGWWDLSFEVLPSTMGFSLAAFAVLLAFGNEEFLRVIAQRPKGKTKSALDGTSAAFFHFLLIQVVALLFAFVGKGLAASLSDLKWGLFIAGIKDSEIALLLICSIQHLVGLFGFLLLIYSITCGLAASGRVLSLSLRLGQVLRRPTGGPIGDQDVEPESRLSVDDTAKSVKKKDG
jgi:hypothetical protein